MSPMEKNNPPRSAMILAAGLGTRMQPLTSDRPKAMVEILGKPLIGHMLDHFAAMDIDTIVVNVHYKPEKLTRYLEAHPMRDKIIVSDESALILDTGGGVRAALPHLGTQPFYVANCDSFFPVSEINPAHMLAKAWADMSARALLLVKTAEDATGYSGAGDFYMSSDAILERRGKNRTAPYIFTGFQILSPDLFEGTDEAVFSLNKIYDQAIAKAGLYGACPPGPWFHIGTPEALAEAENMLTP